MKKYVSLFFVAIMLLFCGCSSNENEIKPEVKKNDYVINSTDKITIGVIAPTTGDSAHIGNDIVGGVEFANMMAQRVNIDKNYEIALSVCDIEDDIKATAKKMIDEKVAAVICYGSNSKYTDSVISAFETENTPILFVDNSSNKITESSTVYTMSADVSYQVSVIASDLQNEAYKKGVIVYEDNEFYKDYAEKASLLMSNNYGISSEVKKYTNASDLASVTKSSDFVFVVGNNVLSNKIASEVKTISSDFPVYLTEMYNKSMFESDSLDGCCFLSKFESDSENHYVTDFINVYSKTNNVNNDDISSAIAYGYDAYMLVYGALGSLNPNSSADPLSSVKNDTNNVEEVLTITSSQVNEALKKEGKIYEGVIDSIVFEQDGTFKPTYIFIDRVGGGSVYMDNKFVY